MFFEFVWYCFVKGPEVRSGDVPQPIFLEEGQEFNFTIKRGVSLKDTVSVNYDDFVNDVEVGDILLVDGKSTGIFVVVGVFVLVHLVTRGGFLCSLLLRRNDVISC